jgi:molybdate transport system ATP-binding protein
VTENIEARFRVEWPGFTLDVDLDLPGRGVTALFGHSGSRKTTLLRCIAGLERARQGFLSFKGEIWQDDRTWLPTHRRPLGYVFQEASLFPHLTALGNLRYGLKRSGAQQTVSLDQVIELLGIGHLLERKPDRLSGGERQRVGIARALAAGPRLLLMDEPLASLDLKRKQEILPYLERLHDELQIPVLYVSHSPDEVARLADHVVLLAQGRAIAQGGLRETLARLDIAGAFAEDAGVVIEAVVAEHDSTDQLTRLDFPGGSVYVTRCADPPGHRLRFRVQASDVSLAAQRPDATSILNLLPASVTEIVDAGTAGQVLVKLDVGGTALIARITGRSRRHLGVEPGRQFWVQIKSVALLR